MKTLTSFIVLLYSTTPFSGTYIFAGDNFGVNNITHPTGQNNNVNVSVLNISVCIDPTSTITAPLEIPVANIVKTWNQLEDVTPNLLFGANNNIPFSSHDWESVVLHEVGHCIGIGHPNLGYQPPEVVGNFTTSDFTMTTKGADTTYDFGVGIDGIYGSKDDIRDDDVNLHWFNTGVNNPFLGAPPFDSTTYSRQVSDLPISDNFVANADRDVGNNLGKPNTEAVMQQLTLNDEAQRDLSTDDIATLKLGMSGFDMIAGNADDYTVNLIYGGVASGCDINIKHDSTYSGLAVCNTGASGFSDHFNITSANIRVNPNAVTWYFNQIEKVIVETGIIFKDGFEN